MPSKTLIQAQDDTPPQICFADFAGDFNPTAANDLREGTDTQVQLSLTGIADGVARQSTKFDYGEHRAPAYSVRVCLEWNNAAAPTSGELVYIYLAPSSIVTAGTGNPGGCSGADSAYVGTSDSLANSVKQLPLIGAHICTDDVDTDGVQIGECGVFSPTERYGSLVVYNMSGGTLWTDDVEIHVVLNPIIPESQ